MTYHMKTVKNTPSDRHGQAMIEFVVGIVAVLVLFAGLLQIIELSTTRTDAMIEARCEVAQAAIGGADVRGTPSYLETWEDGADERNFSADDEPTIGNQGSFRSAILDKAAGNDDYAWQTLNDMPNDVSDLRASDAPVSRFGLLRGQESVTISLIPAIRHLVYDAEEIEIECTVWFPALGGIF